LMEFSRSHSRSGRRGLLHTVCKEVADLCRLSRLWYFAGLFAQIRRPRMCFGDGAQSWGGFRSLDVHRRSLVPRRGTAPVSQDLRGPRFLLDGIIHLWSLDLQRTITSQLIHFGRHSPAIVAAYCN
jgi:hypothetical protein